MTVTIYRRALGPPRPRGQRPRAWTEIQTVTKILVDVSNNLALFNLFFLAAKEVLDTSSESSLAS